MPSAPYSSPSVSKRSFHSRFTCLQAPSWPLLLRGALLGAGMWFAWASLSAELLMMQINDGKPHPTGNILFAADEAVARFPFDPALRTYRRYIRSRIASIPKEHKDASGQ